MRVADVLGDKAKRRIRIFVNRGVEAFIDPGHQLGDVRANAGKQLRVRLGAELVPVLKSDILRLFVNVNLAFDHHEVIGANAEAGPCQGLKQAGEVAAGIDHPPDTGCLRTAEQTFQLGWHGRVFKLREQRSIKIRRNELNGQWHVGGNS